MPHKQVGENYFQRVFQISTSARKIVHAKISPNEIYSVAYR